MRFAIPFIHLTATLLIVLDTLLRVDSISAFFLFQYVGLLFLLILPVCLKTEGKKIIPHLLSLGMLFWLSTGAPIFLSLLPLHGIPFLSFLPLKAPFHLALLALPVWAVPEEYRLLYLGLAFAAFILHQQERRYLLEKQKLIAKTETAERELEELRQEVTRLAALDEDRDLGARMEERNRIAQKIHDELGHGITGGITQLEAAKLILHDDPDRSRRLLDNTIGALQKGLRTLRYDMRSIKPDSAELDLQTIRMLFADFELTTGIRTVLKNESAFALLSAEQRRITRVNIREGLTNITRHSNATVVTLQIVSLEKMIKVEIRDNGRVDHMPSPGLGLRGMEERMLQCSGKLIVDGSAGFSIIMLFLKG